MKKLVKYTSAVLAGLMLLSFSGCDMLQSGLSSELQQKLEEETGSAELDGSTWYYNGSASSDMSADTTSTLSIDYTKKVVQCEDGMTVKYTISYKTADDESIVLTKTLYKSDAGYLSSDGKTLYVYMSPVLSLLDGSSVKNNTASVEVKVSGLLCAEGAQKGRTVSSEAVSVSVEPMYSSGTLSGVTYSTLNSTLNSPIEISTLADEVTLAADAAITSFAATATSGDLTGLSAGDFELSVSGNKVLLTPKVDLYNILGTINFTVTGISTGTNSKGNTQSFTANLGKMVSTSDHWSLSTSGVPNYNFDNMVVSVDTSNLYVTINTAVPTSGWESDHLLVYVDDLNITGDATTFTAGAWGKNCAYTVTTAASVEFIGADIPSSTYGSLYNYRDYSWSQASDWAYYASSTRLTYTIPLSAIDAAASSSDTFRVVAAWADYWGSDYKVHALKNCIPSAAFTYSDESAAIDFSKALILGSGDTVTVAPGTPAYFTATETALNSVTLTWTEAFNAASYKVSYKKASETEWTELSSTTDCTTTVTGLDAGTSYNFKIVSVSSDSIEGDAVTTSAVTGSLPAKAAVSVAASGADLKVSWNKVSDILYYTIYRGTESGTLSKLAALTNVNTTSYTDSTVTGGTTYYYAVSSTNKYGESEKSDEVSVEAPNLPGAFTIAAAFTELDPDGTDVTVSGINATNANSYKVYYKKTSASDYTLVKEITSAADVTIEALAFGKYDVKVVAVNEVGERESTTTVTVYPEITVDGTLEDVYKNTKIASGITNSGYTNTTTENSAITGLYVINDAEYLYIAVDFGSAVPRFLTKNSHLGVIIGSAASTTTSDSASWGGAGIATTTTLSNGGELYSFADQTDEKWGDAGEFSGISSTDVTTNNKWAYEWYSSVNTWKGTSTVCEYKIALSTLNLEAGSTIQIVAGTSDYEWDDDAGNLWKVKDVAPYAAATISEDTTTLTVDLSKALSYTIK